MAMPIEANVGPSAANASDSSHIELRLGRTGDVITSALHGAYFEQNLRGNVYSYGMTSTALSANTITLTATTTPVIGVWNPSTSNVNLVILEATCLITVAGNSAVAPGAFVYATSIGNTAITTGNTPFNRKTLSNVGSSAKAFNIGTALTGLTNNLVIQAIAPFGTLVASQGATATPTFSAQAVHNIDGAFIVPPGGVFAVLNTTSTTTVSVASGIMWEEVLI